ncbi:hypothetical protein QUB80_07740 [Chlorogloeopsis sp. ULAP01]|uniref:hypothetical protein n=1 Tax=Chlorogloeopsis sp. ULAP01 TaxID=3056483 RepID=UPI0025AB0D02|nr:hypothetical protein [Chlorogloeopsis sp. ULAP01]MDM9380596.1 hypothetical protein [Chlorogloeopsis sp. ULAP01]
MTRRITLWSLWAGFIAYILWLAPPFHLEATVILLKNIFTLNWTEVNPVILSLFSLIGIWLFIYSALLFFDGRMQKTPFWPFALATVGAGVIGLLPYLASREPNQEFSGQKDAFLQLLDSRFFGVIQSLTTIGLFAYAMMFGDWAGYWQQFLGDRFIHGMSLAFCLFCLLFPTVLGDDMARRGLNNPQIFWAIAFLPLFGPLIYLCLRPPLPEPSIHLKQPENAY